MALSTLPYNLGEAKIGAVPYLNQTYSPLQYTPQLNKLMEQMYGYGATGIANMASQSPYGFTDEQPSGFADPLMDHAYNQALMSSNKFQAPESYQLKKLNLSAVPQASFSSMDFDPIEQQARAGFEQSTIPTIAERFTSMGAGASGSGAFARTLGGAAAGLEQNLASMKAQLLPQWEMQKAQYGLQRSALDQQNSQMRLNRDLAQAQLDRQYKQMGLSQQLAQQQNLQNFALQRDQAMQQAQQLRTTQLLGLLGFSPPRTYGSPTTKQVANPAAIGTQLGKMAVPLDSGVGQMSNATTFSRLSPVEALNTLSGLGYSVPQRYLKAAPGALSYNMN